MKDLALGLLALVTAVLALAAAWMLFYAFVLGRWVQGRTNALITLGGAVYLGALVAYVRRWRRARA